MRLLRIAPDNPQELKYAIPLGLKVMAVFDLNDFSYGVSVRYETTTNGFKLLVTPNNETVFVVCTGEPMAVIDYSI